VSPGNALNFYPWIVILGVLGKTPSQKYIRSFSGFQMSLASFGNDHRQMIRFTAYGLEENAMSQWRHDLATHWSRSASLHTGRPVPRCYAFTRLVPAPRSMLPGSAN
jgi:hypothetical protein